MSQSKGLSQALADLADIIDIIDEDDKIPAPNDVRAYDDPGIELVWHSRNGRDPQDIIRAVGGRFGCPLREMEYGGITWVSSGSRRIGWESPVEFSIFTTK